VTEINPVTIEHLRAIGIEAKTPGEALAAGFGHTFDAVTCWHVLEHVTDPRELARWTRSVLAPAGIFQVTVPDISSWQAKLFGRHWLHLDAPRHRYHFTADTLDRLLRDSAFDPIARSTFAFEYDWFGAVQSPLNIICSRPNVLFEEAHVAGANVAGQRGTTWRIVSSRAADRGADAAVVPLFSWVAGRGATLTVTCWPTAPRDDRHASET
jgi:SAM-dependent methyltransferase